MKIVWPYMELIMPPTGELAQSTRQDWTSMLMGESGILIINMFCKIKSMEG